MRRFDDARAAGCDRGTDLACAHGHGKVPWRDQQTGPDRLLCDEEPRPTGGRSLVAAVNTQRLAGEVAQELNGICDLTAGLGLWLAHLQSHQQCQVVEALVHELERAREDVRALARRRLRERPLGRHRGLERAAPVRRAGIGHRGEHQAGSRVDDLERLAALGVHPLAVDEQAGGDVRNDAPLPLRLFDAHRIHL